MLCDLHSHSLFSYDGAKDALPAAMCEQALRCGITDLAITDHMDINFLVENLYTPYRYDEAKAAIEAAAEQYRGKLNLIRGVELGNPHHYPYTAARWLHDHPYDLVIGSLHELRGEDEISHVDYSGWSVDEMMAYLGRCIRENLEILNWGHIDILAHLTYPHRYFKRKAGLDRIDYSLFRDDLSRLFERMMELDVCLELNVSALWQGYGFPLTHPDVLKQYYDCGGRLVTIGSDAHTPSNLGRCVADGLAILQDIGFSHVCVWRGGERVQIPIQEMV